MSVKYTRAELGAILDARQRAGTLEGQGDGAFFDFWFRITPDLLYELMGARIVHADGSESTLDGVLVGEAGYVEPIITRHAPTTTVTRVKGETPPWSVGP